MRNQPWFEAASTVVQVPTNTHNTSPTKATWGTTIGDDLLLDPFLQHGSTTLGIAGAFRFMPAERLSPFRELGKNARPVVRRVLTDDVPSLASRTHTPSVSVPLKSCTHYGTCPLFFLLPQQKGGPWPHTEWWRRSRGVDVPRRRVEGQRSPESRSPRWRFMFAREKHAQRRREWARKPSGRLAKSNKK